VAKYSILLSIKEGYLFVRNWLGMVLHPFKTLRALFREQDFSQIFLVLGFPLYALFGGLGVIWLGRRLVKAVPGQWGVLTKGSVTVLFILVLIVFVYLAFWLYQIWKLKKFKANTKKEKYVS
jgi:hypothetical protein